MNAPGEQSGLGRSEFPRYGEGPTVRAKEEAFIPKERIKTIRPITKVPSMPASSPRVGM